MYRKVLIAVDGSEPSNWAVESGTCLAAAMGARIALVYVIDASEPLDAATSVTDEAGVLRAMRREGRRMLREMLEALPHSLGECCILREGRAAGEIVAAARDWNADLVVLGAHGHARLAPFLLGGTADAVARQADCPVMVVARKPRQAKRASERDQEKCHAHGNGYAHLAGRIKPLRRDGLHRSRAPVG